MPRALLLIALASLALSCGGESTMPNRVCSTGDVEPCYSGPPGTDGIGICRGGSRACRADGSGFEDDCTGEITPRPEDCATPEDDDCNGRANEAGAGCACAPGQTSACYSGAVGTTGVGHCKAGIATCNADGLGFGPCGGEILPEAESCATPGDDDCDGQVNEGCACAPGEIAPCYDGPAATLAVGICKAGSATCLSSGQGYGACTGEVLPAAKDDCATPEDENCDGNVNEAASACVCAPGATASCYDGPAGTEGVGACITGMKTCLPSGDGFGPCAGQVLPAAKDDCATPEDENCDGNVNEASSGCVCQPNETQVCYDGAPGTEGVGVCKAGLRTCIGGAFGPCVGEQIPMIEDARTLANENCTVDDGETWWRVPIPNPGVNLAADGIGGVTVVMRRSAAVAGYEPVNPASYPEILVARFDASGAFQWGKEAFGTSYPTTTSLAYRLDAGANGHIALTAPVLGQSPVAFGQSPIHTTGSQTVRVIYSVGPDGALLYSVDAPKLHPFEDSNTSHSIAAGTDGSVFYSNGLYTNQHVIKYGPGGAVAWDHVNSASPDSLDLAALPDGGVVLAMAASGTVDVGLGPIAPSTSGARDLVIARYDAAGSCLWAARPGPAYAVHRVAVEGSIIAIATSSAFVRASLTDGSILSTDPTPAGLGYTPSTVSLAGEGAAFGLYLNAGTTDFGLGPQAPYGGAAVGHFYVLREVGATRWARSPGVSFSAWRVAARAGGFFYATITGHDQLDFDGVLEPVPPTAYYLVRMAAY
jgi:hypothetical protein